VTPSKPVPRIVLYRPAEGLQDPLLACLFDVRDDPDHDIGLVVYRHGGVICIDYKSRNAAGEAGGWWDVPHADRQVNPMPAPDLISQFIQIIKDAIDQAVADLNLGGVSPNQPVPPEMRDPA
jgi:hypothetical protein